MEELLTVRQIARCVVGAVSVVALAACADAAPAADDVPDRWRAQIDAILDARPNEYEGQILADYEVTDDELREVRDAFGACLEGHGIEYELSERGGSFIENLPGDETGTETGVLADGCEADTVGRIEWIYWQMHDNPSGMSEHEALRQCLDESDVGEFADLSADELARLADQGDLEPRTPEAFVCLADPFGERGMTLDEAAELLETTRD